MTENENENWATADRDDRVKVLHVRGDLDLATASGLYERGQAAIADHTRLLLFDLTGLSFCDARGLSAFVRMANDADTAGCAYGLIAPKPQVADVLRITGLGTRLRVFATIEQARQRLTVRCPARR